jgi:hypothetical protein
MLNTYIKNRGTTKTIILDNNHGHINHINWDADYDGDVANISIDTESNGKSKHFEIKLDNNDLANLLNIKSVNMPIDKRLEMDFDDYKYAPEPYFIELPTPEFKPREPIIKEPDTTIEELIDRRISSPKSDEIFLPLSIDSKAMDKYTLTPKKRHKHRKTHVTHKLIKKTKSKTSRTTRSKYSKPKSKSRTSRSRSTPLLDLL